MQNTNFGTNARLLWVLIFSVAMAYLEAAVVVYLRTIYYPQGFEFPLKAISAATLFIELGREAATVAMLVAIGIICGRSKIERFAYLMLSFGLWDILYYVWLRVFIGWPASLLTWDILFLIPLPWVGPVLAPILISLALVLSALYLIIREDRRVTFHFPRWAWWIEIVAGLIIIASFLWDVRSVVGGGYPRPFRWDIFSLGLIAGLFVFIWQARAAASGKLP